MQDADNSTNAKWDKEDDGAYKLFFTFVKSVDVTDKRAVNTAKYHDCARAHAGDYDTTAD